MKQAALQRWRYSWNATGPSRNALHSQRAEMWSEEMKATFMRYTNLPQIGMKGGATPNIIKI